MVNHHHYNALCGLATAPGEAVTHLPKGDLVYVHVIEVAVQSVVEFIVDCCCQWLHPDIRVCRRQQTP